MVVVVGGLVGSMYLGTTGDACGDLDGGGSSSSSSSRAHLVLPVLNTSHFTR